MSNDQPVFREVSHSSKFLPDYLANSVTSIPIQLLHARGIRHVILDIDDTLVPRGTLDLNPAIVHYFADVRKAGIELSIGSNSRRDLSSIATSIDAQIIPRRWWSYKPLGVFYEAILTRSNSAPESTAMIGDHMLNDIIGPKRLHITTILVRPLNRKPGWILRRYTDFAERRSTVVRP